MPPTLQGHWTRYLRWQRNGEMLGEKMGQQKGWLVCFAMGELLKVSVCLGIHKKIKRDGGGEEGETLAGERGRVLDTRGSIRARPELSQSPRASPRAQQQEGTRSSGRRGRRGRRAGRVETLRSRTSAGKEGSQRLRAGPEAGPVQGGDRCLGHRGFRPFPTWAPLYNPFL